jgi:hypothetical protein
VADAGFDALVAQARAALDGPPPDPVHGAEPGPFAGRAADGLVRAEVGLDGTVLSLSIDAQLHGRALDEIAAEARSAINAALDARPGAPDFTPLIAEIRTAQDEARRGLSAITQGMAEVAQHVQAARGGPR